MTTSGRDIAENILRKRSFYDQCVDNAAKQYREAVEAGKQDAGHRELLDTADRLQRNLGLDKFKFIATVKRKAAAL